tara:strand:- start:64 stop:687 length:624 start_codon:yes stop_codon:yes gene_type:complete
MKKLFLYIFLGLMFCNVGSTNQLNLTNYEIAQIVKKIESNKKKMEFLRCVEIIKKSNVQRKIFKHQIKKIKCRLTFDELNVNYKKEKSPPKIDKKKFEEFTTKIEKDKEKRSDVPKIISFEDYKIIDSQSLLYLTKVKLFNNNPNGIFKLKNKKYLNFKPSQIIYFNDIENLNEKEFLKLPFAYNEDKLKFRKIIFEFKKEKKKRKL